jgi:hypothetical protein
MGYQINMDLLHPTNTETGQKPKYTLEDVVFRLTPTFNGTPTYNGVHSISLEKLLHLNGYLKSINFLLDKGIITIADLVEVIETFASKYKNSYGSIFETYFSKGCTDLKSHSQRYWQDEYTFIDRVDINPICLKAKEITFNGIKFDTFGFSFANYFNKWLSKTILNAYVKNSQSVLDKSQKLFVSKLLPLIDLEVVRPYYDDTPIQAIITIPLDILKTYKPDMRASEQVAVHRELYKLLEDWFIPKYVNEPTSVEDIIAPKYKDREVDEFTIQQFLVVYFIVHYKEVVNPLYNELWANVGKFITTYKTKLDRDINNLKRQIEAKRELFNSLDVLPLNI